MTSSGTITFSENCNQIILTAFRKIGAFASGEVPDQQSIQDASDALNALCKHLETSGIHLWTETEGTLFLQPGQASYGIGGGATDHATLSTAYTLATLTADAPNGAGSITVSAATGFTAGSYIGVLLDSGTTFWTTQVGAIAGLVVTLAAPLSDSAAAGNFVFVYATQLERPLRIVGARKVQWSGSPAQQIETPMNPMLARLDYRALPNKLATGIPTQIFYDPQLGTGVVNVWPAPQNSLYGVNFTFYRTIQDFDTAANTPDLPQEWIRTLYWNLAMEMAPEYDCPPERYQMISEMAMKMLEEVSGWDREPESLYCGVSIDQRSGN